MSHQYVFCCASAPKKTRAGALLTEHAALSPFAMLTQRSCRKVLPSNAWTDEHVILRRVKLKIGTLGTGDKQDEPLLVPVLFFKSTGLGRCAGCLC